MSDSEHPENSTPEASWPEDGGQWSDGEGGELEESDLLQEVVEEDEEIDLYNEETFGLEADQIDLLFVHDDKPPSPPASPPPTQSVPSPPRPKPQIQPRTPASPADKTRIRRERPGQRQLFDDPAVMRTVEGPPSIKSLDSAIVDCGRSSFWGDLNANTVSWNLKGQSVHFPCFFFWQDQAIVGVIDKSARGRMPYGSPVLRSPLHPVGHRGLPKVGLLCQVPLSPLVSSPLRPHSPFSIKQRYNQSGVFLSPSRPRFHSPQPLTPKMMQVRFGPNSPRPGPCYSPFSAPIQLPVLATQLHPQHKRLLNQRPLGPCRKSKSWDLYAEIMSAKEKEWVIRLQMMQLQSENPYQDDYYYQEYYRRMEVKLAEEEMLGDRSKREPPKLTTPYVTKTVSYTPVVHIEGSLGQVAVSTCYSPRRAIDAVHVHEQKDTRQQRLEVLNIIEKCYVILLGVEEAERTKATVSDEEEKKRLMKTMQRGLEEINKSTEEFLQCLLLSKGKRLLARLLPFLTQEAARHILTVITTHLPALMSRDTDEALPILYPSLRAVINTLTFTQLVSILQDFTSDLPDSKDSRLTLACQNKFGLSLLYALLSQGERLLTSDVPMEPSIGDFETWTDTVFHVARQLSRTSLVEPLFLPSNLLTLFCRYLDKQTVQQLKNNMESSAGYLAVGS
uniref:PAT1 homolog 2 n=1 Tax=Astyanax mexicanus TaxID=7994 RepID=W5LM36_ASTMX